MCLGFLNIAAFVQTSTLGTYTADKEREKMEEAKN
jgi:hypothetical protein